MKRITTALISSLAISTCMASPLSGYYAAAGLSYQATTMSHTAALSDGTVSDPENFTQSTINHGDRLAPHLALGLASVKNKWYLAAEASVDMANQTFWDNPLGISQRTRLNWVTNVDAKIGHLIAQHTALYLLLGGATARLHASYGGNAISSTFINLQQNSSSQQAFAYQLGFGLRYALANHWSTELSYHHNFWGSTGFGLNDSIITFTNPIGHSSVGLDNNNAVWQLVYRF